MFHVDAYSSSSHPLYPRPSGGDKGGGYSAYGSIGAELPLRRFAQIGGKIEVVYDGDVPVLTRFRGNPGAVASGGGLRGEVTGFSRGSQKRLHLVCTRLLVGAAKTEGATHVVLTFGRNGGYDYETSKRALANFRKRLARAHPSMPYIWVAELQQRGAVHFHLLVVGVFTPEEKEHLRLAWVDVAGLNGNTLEERSLVSFWTDVVNTSVSMAPLVAYLGKEISKLSQEQRSPQWKGRWWGKSKIQKHHLAPIHTLEELAAEIHKRAVKVDEALRPCPRAAIVENAFGIKERITSIPTQHLGTAAEYIATGNSDALRRLQQEADDAGIV